MPDVESPWEWVEIGQRSVGRDRQRSVQRPNPDRGPTRQVGSTVLASTTAGDRGPQDVGDSAVTSEGLPLTPTPDQLELDQQHLRSTDGERSGAADATPRAQLRAVPGPVPTPDWPAAMDVFLTESAEAITALFHRHLANAPEDLADLGLCRAVLRGARDAAGLAPVELLRCPEAPLSETA